MVSGQVRNAYQKSECEAKIHPVKLIHMLYERGVAHLQKAEEALLVKDAKVRGENLGKVIAIITELNASIKEDDEGEAAQFLRGLYSAILIELPKVSVSGDVEKIRKAIGYLQGLKELWEKTAMKEAGLTGRSTITPEDVSLTREKDEGTVAGDKKYGTVQQKPLMQSLSVAI